MDTNETPVLNIAPRALAAWQLAGLLILAFAVGVGVSYVAWVSPLQSQKVILEKQLSKAQIELANATSAQQPAQEVTQNQPVRYPVTLDDDPILGVESADITLIEFSDYECPFCQKWHAEVFPKLKEKYGDQIRFVYRDFPLYSIHPNAASAAEAAQCAHEQNKFWDYHELLFSGAQPFNQTTYLDYAQQLGLETSGFQECLTSRRYQAEVEADYQYASNLGVQSTPTFFINGLAVVGAQPFSVFEQLIDMELAGEIPQ